VEQRTYLCAYLCNTRVSGLRISNCEELSVLGEHDNTLWVLWPVCLWSRSQTTNGYFLIQKAHINPNNIQNCRTLRNGDTVGISSDDSVHLNILEELRGLIRCIEKCTPFPLNILLAYFNGYKN
jgi:hypothetical protein